MYEKILNDIIWKFLLKMLTLLIYIPKGVNKQKCISTLSQTLTKNLPNPEKTVTRDLLGEPAIFLQICLIKQLWKGSYVMRRDHGHGLPSHGYSLPTRFPESPNPCIPAI